MRYYLFFIFFTILSAAQERIITVKDTENQVVPYVTVNFKNGYGSYTDEKGEFKLPEGVTEIEFSHLAYQTEIIAVRNMGNTIVLNQVPIMLQEVNLTTITHKPHSYHLKPQKVNDAMSYAGFGTYGFELAFLISSNDTIHRALLQEIELPVLKTDDLYGNSNNKPKGILLRLNFYSNNSDMPGDLISHTEELIVVYPEDIKKRVLKIKLKAPQEIVPEGVFAVFTLMGEVNESGNLMVELPYTEHSRAGSTIKIVKTVDYAVPLFESKSPVPSAFSRSMFSDNKEWSLLQPPVRRPEGFYFLSQEEKDAYVEKERKNQKIYSLGAGYTIDVYK